MAFLNANIPPLECFVRSNFLQGRPIFERQDEYFRVVVFGVASIPHRVPLFHFLMEDEALWWRMPIHAFCSKPCEQVPLHQLVLWDCYSPYVSVTQFDLLLGKRVRYLDRDRAEHGGTYLFTLDWAQEDRNVADLGFSEAAGQHKCGHVLKLDPGNFAIQPNNRVRLFDPSFTTKAGTNLIERKLNEIAWSVEDENRWILSDDENYHYSIGVNARPRIDTAKSGS